MLVADSGGGYGGTNWFGTTMEQMWLALENQDTTPHWNLLSGWQKSYELTLQHLSRVQSFRENLATAWPPEKSPASAAYLERLDDLIKYLQNTYDAAIANHSAFSSATSALADSRRKLKVVYDAYVANKGKIDAYDARMAKGNPGGGKSVARFTAPPPVTDQQQEQLTNQARSIMYGLSTEISQAHASIVAPAKYEPEKAVMDRHEKGGAPTYAPPIFPPLFPSDVGSRSSRATSNVSPPHTPVPPSGSHTGHPGLVLGGTSPVPVTIPPGPVPGILPSPPATPPPNTINPPIGLPGLSPGSSFPSTTGPMPGQINGGGLVKPGVGGVPTGGMRSMPPGGVIGGMPGVGLGQPGGGARSAQRVSPVGGVINPGGAGSRPGSAGTTSGQSGMPFGGMGGRGATHRGDNEQTSHWDPDNPWQTDEGVAPVVLPSSEQRIDPGPAIGFDR
jgi:hypothetical protein